MPLLKWRSKRREAEKFAKLPHDAAATTTSIDHLSVCDKDSNTTTSEQASVSGSAPSSPLNQDLSEYLESPGESLDKTSQVSENLAGRGLNDDSHQNVAIRPQIQPDFTPECQGKCEDVDPADDGSEDLWERAYESLRSSKEAGEQMQKYEAILEANMESKANIGKPSIGDHGSDRLTRMSALAINKMQVIDDSKWQFHLGKRSVELKKILEQTVKAITFAKDFVSSAASSEPHAALAWAGVSMLLPLLLNPTNQRESLAKGIEYISTLIMRFTIIERTYKQQRLRMKHYFAPDHEKLNAAFESHITKLYAQILCFQAKAVCQLYKSSLKRHAFDTIKINDWATMLSEIKEQEMESQKYFDVIGSANLNNAFKEQHEHVEKLFRSQEKLFQAWNVDKRRDRDDKEQRHQSKQESEALKALCTTTYRDHKNRNPDRVKGTCRWFLESQIYCSWRLATGSGMLWVTADPGCGKSVLAKSLIDEELQSTTQMTTIYFFFKDDSAEQQSAVHALCALLHQLCDSKPALLHRLAEAYQRNGSTLMLSFSWLWALFMELTEDKQAGEVLCVLDALDECRLEERQILIDHLNEFYLSKEQSKRKLRFLITSRPYLDIEERFDKIILRLAAEEESEIISQEIDLVIRASVARIAIRKQLDQNTQTLLENRLLETQNRTYLWLHLAIDCIEKASGVGTPRRMAKLIDAIPNSVYQAYESILSRSTDRAEAVELLHIVVAAMRPLSLREMNMALNLKSGQVSVDEIDLYPEAHFERHIRNLCGLFINVHEEDDDRDSKIMGDREQLGKVYLIHQTAREFLLESEISVGTASRTMRASCGKEKDLVSLSNNRPPIIENVMDPEGKPYGVHQVSAEPHLWQHSIQIRQAHLLLAHKCMSYLMLECADDKRLAGLPSDFAQGLVFQQELLEEACFLKYTARHWFHHFAKSNDTKILLEIWHLICGGMVTRYVTAPFAFKHCDSLWASLFPEYLTTLTELMWAICIQHETLVASLIEKNTDLEECDWRGFTALVGAIECKSPAGVNLILANGASVNVRDCDCLPLSKYVTRIWVKRYFPIFTWSRFRAPFRSCIRERGWTPLHMAVRMKNMDERMRCTIIRLLLDAGADPNMEDNECQKPLDMCQEGSYAAAAILRPLTSFKLTSLRMTQKFVWVATFSVHVILFRKALLLPWYLHANLTLIYCACLFYLMRGDILLFLLYDHLRKCFFDK